MAIQIVPIIKALTPLIANASGIAAAVSKRRREGQEIRSEEEIRRIEDDLIRTGEVLSALGEQVRALAEEMRLQAEAQLRLRKRLNWAVAVAACAGLLAAGALALQLNGV